MKNITFNSKETYLAYRSAWKGEYKKLSTEIRTLRLAERFWQRKEFGRLPLTTSEEDCVAAANKLPGAGSFVYKRQIATVPATEMLTELKEAKLEAQRQYLDRKAAQTSTPPTNA